MPHGKVKVNPIQVEKFLKGVDYPAHKRDLMKFAKQNKAPDDILHALQNLHDQEFDSPVDVSKAIAEME